MWPFNCHFNFHIFEKLEDDLNIRQLLITGNQLNLLCNIYSYSPSRLKTIVCVEGGRMDPVKSAKTGSEDHPLVRAEFKCETLCLIPI